MPMLGHEGERDPVDTRLALKLYEEYKTFFAHAERHRRWNVFDDIPWDQVRKDVPEELAVVAETFMAVEAYLPDYVAGGLAVVRPYMGSLWFQTNWGYEESKHALSLQEYLLRSGARTDEQMVDLQNKLWAGKRWTPLFKSGRQMTIYGSIQEQATFVFYVRQRERAKELGHDALAHIFDLIARDEVAHTKFYQGVVKVLLEEDREGTLRDLALVSKDFKMPAYDLVPDYDQRVLVMRDLAGMDRDMFFQKVYFPVLKGIGVTRNDVVQAMARQRREQEATAPSAE
jgi:acyl-[acyl-carrier-protein] desaturase